MSVDSIKTALLIWMSRETGLTVIFANQAKHRPTPPYGTINFLNAAQRIGVEDSIIQNGEEIKTAGQRRATASLNIIGKNANDLMSALRDSLDRPDVVEEFQAAGIAHIGEAGPNDMTTLLETKFEERSQMDLFIAFAQEREAEIGFIEHVEIENEDTGETIIVETEED